MTKPHPDQAGYRRYDPEWTRGEQLRLAVKRLGFLQHAQIGTADDSTYLRGDGTWAHIEVVRFPVKNNSGGTLAKGTPVYITGSVGASGASEVAAAEASNAAKMPCVGLLEEELLNNGEGFATSLGVLRGLDTSGYAINQVVFVGGSGGLTGTRPTAPGTLVQNIGRVMRVSATTGEILVMGPGRTNDVPNYTASKLLGRGAGGGDGAAQEITLGTNLSMSGTTLNATGGSASGDITASGYTMLDGYIVGRATGVPGQQSVAYLSVGKGLEISGGGIRIPNLGVDTAELKASAVTYSKIQNVSATDKLLGRSSAGAGVVEEITCTAAGRALLDDVDAAAQRATMSAGRQVGQRYVELFDDLLAPLAWNGSVSGTGSARTTASAFSASENTVGMVGCFTGTTTTGRASNYDGDEGLWFANGWTWMLETRACVDTLADATNDYAVYLGFCDNNAAAGEPTDGAYFKYVRSVTGTFWVCTTASNGTRTATTTAVAPANLIMQVFRVDVNEAGTSVEFRIDGTLVATHTTNIPSASARSTGIGQKIQKSAGTTSRTLYIDYIWLQGSRTTDR